MHMFWVLKITVSLRTVSLRRFFWVATTICFGWEIRKLIFWYTLLTKDLPLSSQFLLSWKCGLLFISAYNQVHFSTRLYHPSKHYELYDLDSYCLQYRLPKYISRWESRWQMLWLVGSQLYFLFVYCIQDEVDAGPETENSSLKSPRNRRYVIRRFWWD